MSTIDLGNLVVLPKAVGSNLVIWSAGSFATVLLFNILRPRNKIVYEPKTKYQTDEKAPPPINNGFFSWVKPLWSTPESVLLDKVGLDGVTFLRFLRMMSWIFLFVSVITCGALIPINVAYNRKYVDEQKRNTLSILTVQDVEGKTLFFHVAASYLINIIVLAFIWYNWKKMVALRHAWFRSDEYTKSFYARTLMILNVPKKLQSDEGLQSLFAGLQIPYPATSVHIGRRVGQLPELVEYHNNTVRSFEEVLVSYLKGGKIGKKRPTITIGGCLGFGGEKKDAIEFYTRKLAKTEAAVVDWREKAERNKVENYGFASLAAVPYAHIVAQRMAGKHPKGTTITLAPNPKDIIWQNITMSDAARRSQRMIGWLWLALICFLYTIPLLFVSLVANLSHIAQYVKFLDTWQTDSQWTFALVNGILPPAIVSFFGFFLPKIMRRLSKYQGDITRSRLDRAVVARYFAFLIISQLFIFSLLGVGFQLVTKIVIKVQNQQNVWDILKDVKGLPGDIQSTYISQAPYWLTFFPLRGFLAVFDLAQLLQLALVWIKTRLFGRTPRDIIEYTKCPEFEYSIYYSNLLFMGAVGLVYAPLAPLVALAAAAVFWLSVLVYKYQIMFVFVSKVESGGRLWNPIVNRLLSSLVFMQLLMTLTIGLTHGWRSYYWVSCLPPLLLVAGCKVWFARTFMRRFRYYIPTDQEIANAVVHSGKADNTGNRLERRFGHPALHADLFTPLLHKKMMPLLAEVYNGRLGTDSATMEEYGGKKMQAQIAPGGIKIAGVDEKQLEDELAMYQRDRGELDWDQRSIGASTVLGDGASLHHSKSGFYAPSGRNVPAGYDQYMQQGPMRTGTPGAGGLTVNSYEMSRRGASEANLPLLATRSEVSVGGHQGYESQHSLHERSPSVGPQAAYGASPMTHDAPSGYFQSPPYGHQAYPPPPHDASEAAARYHARANSAGFEQAISPATGYPPQQHYVERSQSPSVYQQRSGSAMGYHQQSPSRGYTPSDQGPPSRYYTPSPTMHQDPNDYNMAGRGARGQNY
ncbi:hypothetical protein FS842_002232 [Serendipita sp. 407]|nr:hypothetical protein FS842_002232 [Serendipita sp. 407]